MNGSRGGGVLGHHLAKHPEQRDEKLRGRALWWDKSEQSMDEMKRAKESKVAQNAYVYDAN